MNVGVLRNCAVLVPAYWLRAETQGHPLRWTSDDVESARQLANTLSRPWGHLGQTPDEAWQTRSAITAEERANFHSEVAARRAVAGPELGLDPQAELNHCDQSRLDRVALPRALVATGNLHLQRATQTPRNPKRLSRQELAERATAHFAAQAPTPEVAPQRVSDPPSIEPAAAQDQAPISAASGPLESTPKIPLASAPTNDRITSDEGAAARSL